MPPSESPSRRRSTPSLLPNRRRARVAIAGLLYAIATATLQAGHLGYQLAVWRTIDDPAVARWLILVEDVLSVAVAATMPIGAITFLFWFRRAYGNAIALGHRAAFAPGWAVGAWFVPILNLVRPYQIASAMWRHAGRRVSSPSLLGFWWACFLTARVSTRIGAVLIAADRDDTRLFVTLAIAADVAGVAAGVLAILFVQRLTRAHEAMVPESAAEVFA